MTRQTTKCRQCQKNIPHVTDMLWYPFCSERCKQADLGAWFNEERFIASSPLDEDLKNEPDDFPS